MSLRKSLYFLVFISSLLLIGAVSQPAYAQTCIPTGPEGPFGNATCSDGEDNDCDGLLDAADASGGVGTATINCSDPTVDNDGDLKTENDGDCNDGDSTVYPGAPRICDGKDNNCDGRRDFTTDVDGDGDGYARCAECNDNNKFINPGVFEGLSAGNCGDSIDNDCDWLIDQAEPSCLVACIDQDGDGYGVNGDASCDVPGELDCDDSNASAHPGGNDANCNGIDEDCNDLIDDGYVADASCGTGLCFDTNTASSCSGGVETLCSPGAPVFEGPLNDATCTGGLDEDCDGFTDLNDPGCLTDCVDQDGDGYGANGGSTCGVPLEVDCDDSNASAHPGGNDANCNGIDEDCIGGADSGYVADASCGTGLCFDTNTASSCTGGVETTCSPGTPVAENTPGVGVCKDGVDNDCDGLTDDFDIGGCSSLDSDDDGDNFTENQGDCDDTNATVYPGAPKLCDGLDNNCDGRRDFTTDVDGDGDGYARCGECDDSNKFINPGVFEGLSAGNCGDSIDNDCDWLIDQAEPSCQAGAACEADVETRSCGTTDVGECQFGQETCDSNGQWTLGCVGNIEPAAESCDGLDTDCDGDADGLENLTQACGTTDVGACSFGTESCDDLGAWIGCDSVEPAAEVCTGGVDDDCDGDIDLNDTDCVACEADVETRSCGTTDVGECQFGQETCDSNGQWTLGCVGNIEPAAESCDGLDTDCDGDADGLENLTQACGTTDVGACSFGTESCDDLGAWIGCDSVEPAAESCDGLDTDCDGNADGLEGLTQQCGTTDLGECSFGTESCTDAGGWENCDAVEPTQEGPLGGGGGGGATSGGNACAIMDGVTARQSANADPISQVISYQGAQQTGWATQSDSNANKTEDTDNGTDTNDCSNETSGPSNKMKLKDKGDQGSNYLHIDTGVANGAALTNLTLRIWASDEKGDGTCRGRAMWSDMQDVYVYVYSTDSDSLASTTPTIYSTSGITTAGPSSPNGCTTEYIDMDFLSIYNLGTTPATGNFEVRVLIEAGGGIEVNDNVEITQMSEIYVDWSESGGGINPTCEDGLDNDCDGFTDIDDSGCRVAVCGDGTLDAGEDCDDGNTADGDCCNSNCSYEPIDSACGDQGIECTNDDTCDGAGACTDNGFEPVTTSCRADAGECDVEEFCDGAGACPADGSEPDGTSCGDTNDTLCDNPDTCTAGACQDNIEPVTTSCRADAGECDVEEFCDGAGACPADGFELNGTTCGNGADTVCDNPDTCNATGVCQVNNEAAGNACGDQGIECLVNDTCDGVGACTDNGFEPVTTSCRADAGECDVEEFCDGAGACPADGSEPDGTSCGSSVDTDCDNPDSCQTGACQDNNEAAGTACNDGEFCTTPDTCDGVGACAGGANDPCNPVTEACNEVTDTCDLQGVCGDGTLDTGEDCDDGNTSGGDCCATDCSFESVGSTCGSGADTECSNPDTCNATGACQDNNEASGFACGDTGIECLVNDTCDGVGACTDNGFEPVTTSCRADAGECDVEEFCDGAGACPADGSEPDGTSCGSSVDTDCDNPDSCQTGACVLNQEPSGTACDDGLYCTGLDTCSGAGACNNSGDPCVSPETCDEVNDTCISVSVSVPCADCHTGSAGGYVTRAIVGGDACSETGKACTVDTDCPGATNVCNNVLGDFDQPYRHVFGGTVTSWDCIVCHREGDANQALLGTVANTALHQDQKVDTRNVDSIGTGGVWDKNNRTDAMYTDMDNFCMSCHDLDGASGINVKITDDGVNLNNTRALTPFNSSDGLSSPNTQGGTVWQGELPSDPGVMINFERTRVNDTKTQFNPNNPSHHAVRGQAYTSHNTSWGAGAWVAQPLKGGGLLTDAYEATTLHCNDCHVENAHGAGWGFRLRAASIDDLCWRCHSNTTYNSSGFDLSQSRFNHSNDSNRTMSPALGSRMGRYGGTAGSRCMNCHGGDPATDGYGGIHGLPATPLDARSSGEPRYRFQGGSYMAFKPNSWTIGSGATTCYFSGAAAEVAWSACDQHGGSGKEFKDAGWISEYSRGVPGDY